MERQLALALASPAPRLPHAILVLGLGLFPHRTLIRVAPVHTATTLPVACKSAADMLHPVLEGLSTLR